MNNELIYIDTNVYIDYFENRTDKLRPLGEFAFNLIKRTLDCEYCILLSSVVIEELQFQNFKKQILELAEELKDHKKILYVRERRRDIKESRKLIGEKKTEFNDTRHAVIARRIGVKYFVIRNIRDFLEFQGFLTLSLPENL